MALIGISITKSISFRGAAQEFSNTYYYDAPAGVTVSAADNAVGLIVDNEKNIHATSVSFVRARAWTAGGTKEQNSMLVDKPLSGTGSLTPNTFLDRERAFLVRARAGIDNLGRPVYLRKWFHLDVAALGGNGFTNAQVQNTAQLAQAQRDALAANFDNIKIITPTGGNGNWELKSEKGRAITGATQAHPYIEHHQLGDMWRG